MDLEYVLEFVYKEALFLGREPLSQVFVSYVVTQHETAFEFSPQRSSGQDLSFCFFCRGRMALLEANQNKFLHFSGTFW